MAKGFHILQKNISKIASLLPKLPKSGLLLLALKKLFKNFSHPTKPPKSELFKARFYGGRQFFYIFTA